MSSMVRAAIVLLLASTAISMPARCQVAPGENASARDQQQPAPESWDRTRAQLIVSPSGMTQAVSRWGLLSASDGRLGFNDYASFIVSYPGFPEEAKMRGWAEAALARAAVSAQQLVAFFSRFPPATNPARAQYAVALAAMGRPEAREVALNAWRGGPMSDGAETAIFATYAPMLTQADHDARMDALLWAGATAQAQRQVLYVSAAARGDFLARLAMLSGQEPGALGLPVSGASLTDPGYVYNRVRQLRRAGSSLAAAQLLASRPRAAKVPLDQVKWVNELLAVARSSDARSAVRIAASIDDTFAPGTDISRLSFKLRDDYTSLMWLGGTKALSSLGDARAAAGLFNRYGNAARTPYTRAKGFYWAGRALAQAGDRNLAETHFNAAAAFPDNFYGMLALERLGRPVPQFEDYPTAQPTLAERAAFEAKPITAAVVEVAARGEWRTTVRFFREISEQAETVGDHLLVAELAQRTGRRDLAVILGQSAHTDGFGNFHKLGYPLIPVPPGASWTMVHAISRQESQFAMNAISHAGARGLMQLMPGTAREQAVKLGMSYEPAALTVDAGYNINLGNAYFARMMVYYGGSYPLAVAAYNAGPGNVNKFLRANGDPRSGSIDWVDWIERIPLSETRAYVQRVLENAVVYEAMHPDKATYVGANPLSHFLGKRSPG